jgi:signal peptidase I
MKLLKTLLSILSTLVWVVVGTYVLLLVATSIPQLSLPQLSYATYVITSGSMEPTIMTGDLIFSKPQRGYTEGDIVTFQDPGHPIITHRIIGVDEKNSQSFITKGDNNEDPDSKPVAAQHIKGKYQLKLPFVGYLLVYGKSPLGLALLIGLPILLMIIDSLLGKTEVNTKSSPPNEP